MSSTRAIRSTLAAALVCVPLSVGAAHAAATAVFADVLGGHPRSKAEKFADATTCGMSASHGIKVIMPVFTKCMREKGWAFQRYEADPAARPRRGTNVNFTDTRGDANAHPRGDAALQADSRACKADRRDSESKIFKQCMAAHGWQFIYAQHAPQSHHAAPAQGSWPMQWGDSSSSSSSNLDDEARRNDESRAATQAASDAMNASNAAVAAQQAADQIQQNNIINQFAPTQP
ncbi:MAG: hypothetical protein WDO17_21170 [Alphaproteobacteria bacterium]